MPYRPRKYRLENDIACHLINRANARVDIFHGAKRLSGGERNN
jgi:ABC-type iron transport system FetAB ATPase subunit